jgi:hypothetical protein
MCNGYQSKSDKNDFNISGMLTRKFIFYVYFF